MHTYLDYSDVSWTANEDVINEYVCYFKSEKQVMAIPGGFAEVQSGLYSEPNNIYTPEAMDRERKECIEREEIEESTRAVREYKEAILYHRTHEEKVRKLRAAMKPIKNFLKEE